MKRKRGGFRPAVFLAVLTILSCVTINIYFPAEKVESVAGEIVHDVRGKPDGDANGQHPKSQGRLKGGRFFFAAGPSNAWAQDVTGVSNAAIRTLKDQMKARYPLLKPYFQNGVLKEGSDGYVAIADAGGLDLKTRRNLTGLVDAENRDRSQLYQEVAKALNIESSQVSRVAAIFAKEWQKSLQ